MSEREELARIAAEYQLRDAPDDDREHSPWRDPAYVHYMHRLERGLLQALAHSGAVIENCSVLDLGCGSGYFLNRLGEFGASKLCGVDLAENRVAAGKARYPALDLRVGSATALPFDNSQFDLVTQFTCFSSVLDPSVRRQMGAEAMRVLRPGGVVISYDLAPVPRPIGAAARAVRRASGSRLESAVTPTVPLSLDDLEILFPGRVLYARAPTLDVGLSQRLHGQTWAMVCLELIPVLRTHLLAAIRC